MPSARPSSVHYGSSSSSSSSDSDLSAASASYRPSMDSAPIVVSVETIRCMRCASATEMTSTDDPSSYGMVRISTNLYYCERCAKKTGFT
ncbi:hypothetical protein HYQ45_010595 [Verticillium longisporum]|nr:conserved hypothetical protein [Verticillium alfalfae VaMs.102]XP_028494880.1 uncharacterized protein D7B24_006969 [Verticillium nonalfalfae]KAG7122775.1 hypothetical protein HYQ44_003673 [Verticillium longisporum]EEY23288.1 conserved hypothetical protein [Verticillium alfalfae VaMs.102]KAG7130592.1 hypothetical protein HYQ45_010595 [Verticillium longisporum]RNJ56722.1 hypothetical protein D7B24_006969 [Verticillium nonalfalfae]